MCFHHWKDVEGIGCDGKQAVRKSQNSSCLALKHYIMVCIFLKIFDTQETVFSPKTFPFCQGRWPWAEPVSLRWGSSALC